MASKTGKLAQSAVYLHLIHVVHLFWTETRYQMCEKEPILYGNYMSDTVLKTYLQAINSLPCPLAHTHKVIHRPLSHADTPSKPVQGTDIRLALKQPDDKR